MFTFDSRIRYSEVDKDGKLNLFGLVNYFQDCCTFQSESIGVGVDSLHRRNLTWVLVNWNIEVLRFPNMCEEIEIGTFPYDFKEYFGMRNFIMKNSEGEILAMGDSLWMLIDYETGGVVKVEDDILSLYVKEEKLSMNYVKGKIKLPKQLEERASFRIGYHHLDANMHVNNSQFINMALDILEGKTYTNLRVEYRKQVRDNDELTPLVGDNENGQVVLFRNQQGENCTILEFKNA